MLIHRCETDGAFINPLPDFKGEARLAQGTIQRRQRRYCSLERFTIEVPRMRACITFRQNAVDESHAAARQVRERAEKRREGGGIQMRWRGINLLRQGAGVRITPGLHASMRQAGFPQ
ncbi:hypothetical protein DOFOFD_11750 [Acetobacteraceae bacterium EV16P]|uniref:Uncharacterized protein n=1 Tax=Sorlinia euscelidii TaxID=3081148 RepID=A0ABU7U496_9PROT